MEKAALMERLEFFFSPRMNPHLTPEFWKLSLYPKQMWSKYTRDTFEESKTRLPIEFEFAYLKEKCTALSAA